MKRRIKWAIGAGVGLAVVGTAFFAGRAFAGGIPESGALTYSGVLQDASETPFVTSNPSTDTIEIKMWNDATATDTQNNLLCDTSPNTLNTDSTGHFSVQLGDDCTAKLGSNPNTYVEILLDGAVLGGVRTKLGAVPYAIEANHAVSADTASNASIGSTLAQQLVPAGTVAMFAGTTIPTGWLVCDGSSVPRASYADLFLAIGTGWGSADTDSFNLPDLRGRFARSADSDSLRDPGPRTTCAPGGSSSAVGTCEEDAFQGWMPKLRTRTGSSTTLDLSGQSDYVLYSQNVVAGVQTTPIVRQDAFDFQPFSSYGQPRVSSETRSTNVAVMYIIKC